MDKSAFFQKPFLPTSLLPTSTVYSALLDSIRLIPLFQDGHVTNEDVDTI